MHAGAEEGRGQALPRPWERDALARHGLGCPKCTAKLAERTDGHAPGERGATQPKASDASGKAAAARALASRASSAQEVADLVGRARSAPCKRKREPLGEEPPMPEDRPSRLARTRGGSPATQADVAAPGARKAELEELELRRDIMEGALEVLGKGTGADPANELTNREKTLLVESPRPKWRLCRLLSALGMARSSYQYQQGALRAPDGDEEARRRISEVFDANDGIYGRRRVHDEPEAGARPSGSAGSPASWPWRGSRLGAGRSQGGATAPTRARSRSIRATRPGRTLRRGFPTSCGSRT